jgi:hypothetical protein
MGSFMYLLGAGASRNALPIVAEFEGSVRTLIQDYQTSMKQYPVVEEDLGPAMYEQFRATQDKILMDLSWLADKSSIKVNASIDTYAKKLYLRRMEPELQRLKCKSQALAGQSAPLRIVMLCDFLSHLSLYLLTFFNSLKRPSPHVAIAPVGPFVVVIGKPLIEIGLEFFKR